MPIAQVILFGTGSPLLVDVEESLQRAGLSVAAGIRNHPGTSYLSPGTPSCRPEEITAAMFDVPFLVPIFTPAYRQQAAQEAARLGLTGPYHNTGCSLGAASSFGAFVLVNRGASIGHHVKLGAFVSIGPGVVVAGQVTIGTGCVIGAGATILPGLTIGDNAVVGAGSVVTRDVPADCLVTGNAAQIVRQDIGGYKGLRVA